MTNIDIHVYKTRDGQWKARISRFGNTEYIDKCVNMRILFEQIERALILREDS